MHAFGPPRTQLLFERAAGEFEPGFVKVNASPAFVRHPDHDRSPVGHLAEPRLAFQYPRLGPLALGNVAEYPGELPRLSDPHFADRQFEGKGGAVLAPPDDFPLEVDLLARREATRHLTIVPFPERPGYEIPDVASHDFVGGIAEQPFRRRVEEFDHALVVDGDDAIDGGGDDRTEPFLAGFKFRRALADALFEHLVGLPKRRLCLFALLDFPLQQGILHGQLGRARLDLLLQALQRPPQFLAHRLPLPEQRHVIGDVGQIRDVGRQGGRVGDGQDHEAV